MNKQVQKASLAYQDEIAQYIQKEHESVVSQPTTSHLLKQLSRLGKATRHLSLRKIKPRCRAGHFETANLKADRLTYIGKVSFSERARLRKLCTVLLATKYSLGDPIYLSCLSIHTRSSLLPRGVFSLDIQQASISSSIIFYSLKRNRIQERFVAYRPTTNSSCRSRKRCALKFLLLYSNWLQAHGTYI